MLDSYITKSGFTNSLKIITETLVNESAHMAPNLKSVYNGNLISVERNESRRWGKARYQPRKMSMGYSTRNKHATTTLMPQHQVEDKEGRMGNGGTAAERQR